MGLKWINSVLNNWREELRACDYSGWTKLPVDRYLLLCLMIWEMFQKLDTPKEQLILSTE